MHDNELPEIPPQPLSSTSHTMIGKSTQQITAQATDLLDIHFDKLKGYQVVLFFCPSENMLTAKPLAEDFAKHYSSFQHMKTCVFGISNTSLADTQSIKNSLGLPFPLIADTKHELSTWLNHEAHSLCCVLINSQGIITQLWPSHLLEHGFEAEDVVEAAHALQNGFTQPLCATLAQEPELPKTQAHQELAVQLAQFLDVYA